VSRPTFVQLIPFDKQTATPFTNTAEEVTMEAESTFAFSVFPVALPKVRIPIEAVLEFNKVPVAVTNENSPVEARLVAVVF
jgi:hypothetical protein